jgi:alpha-amylase/alpha-mannosidase (GH57 family)
MIAEGSDWNWWYGDENFTAQKDLFDELYRSHLRNVYERLDLSVPKDLTKPIADRFSNNSHTEKPKSSAMHRATDS